MSKSIFPRVCLVPLACATLMSGPSEAAEPPTYSQAHEQLSASVRKLQDGLVDSVRMHRANAEALRVFAEKVGKLASSDLSGDKLSQQLILLAEEATAAKNPNLSKDVLLIMQKDAVGLTQSKKKSENLSLEEYRLVANQIAAMFPELMAYIRQVKLKAESSTKPANTPDIARTLATTTPAQPAPTPK